MEIDEVNIVQVDSPEIVYQQDKAVIDMQIATAKMYPRNIQRSVDNAISIVGLDRETAMTCTYSVPRGGKSISGPSVHLAKILIQVWGNMRCEAKVIEIGTKHITSQATAFDLENNVAIKVEVKRSLMTKNGRMNDDMITVTGNAANSIALRNAILSVIPRGVVDKVYYSALDKITGDISDDQKLIVKRKEVFDKLKELYDVSEIEALSAVGKKTVMNVDREDLVVLFGIIQAIKDGDTTVDTAFKGKKDSKAEISLDDLQKAFNDKKNLLSKKELEDAERIINGKEELSYSKLLTLLNSKDDKR